MAKSLEDELELVTSVGAPVDISDIADGLETEKKQTEFLAAYARYGTIERACAETNVSRDRVRRWRKSDTAFQTNFDLADARYTERLEDLLDKQVEKNPILLMFALKKRNPAYRENYKMDVSGEVTIRVIRYDETALPSTTPPKSSPIETTAERCSP
jgi:hypothetical protein